MRIYGRDFYEAVDVVYTEEMRFEDEHSRRIAGLGQAALEPGVMPETKPVPVGIDYFWGPLREDLGPNSVVVVRPQPA